MNVALKIIENLAALKKGRDFLICERKALTSTAFLQCVANRQQQLVACGVKLGDKLLVSNDRAADYWVDLVAVWAMGAIVVPIDSKAEQGYIEALITTVSPKAILGECTYMKALSDIAVIADCKDLSAMQPTVVAVDQEIAAILFTSGTTGKPKGVVLTHANIVYNVQSVLKRIDFKQTDRLFIATRFNFTSAICHFLATAYCAAVMIVTEKKLLPANLVAELTAAKASCFGGAPIQIRWIVEVIAANACSAKLSWLFSSGDYMAPETANKLYKVMPNTTLYVVYGLTEVAGRLCILASNQNMPYQDAVGAPIGEIQIAVRDRKGTLLPIGEVGDIYVRGPSLFRGYYQENRPAVTEWGFKTGDVGYLDQNGRVYLSGRSDCVFKCSGQKVSTLPIANALLTLNLFQDVVVLALQDETMGHVPWVFYVPKKDKQFNKGKVLAKLREILPLNHVPRNFTELSQMPRTGAGKPNFQALKEWVL